MRLISADEEELGIMTMGPLSVRTFIRPGSFEWHWNVCYCKVRSYQSLPGVRVSFLPVLSLYSLATSFYILISHTGGCQSLNLGQKPIIWQHFCERSQNTVLLASTQAVYKAPHSTVRHSDTHTHRVSISRGTDVRAAVAVAVAVGSLRA